MSTNRFSIPAAIVVLLVVAVSVVASKRDSHPIYKFSTDQGLSSSVTYSILQDKKGFIWIGTEEGLNKFDGYHFTHFNADKGRHSLTHNRTQTLYNAPDGSIWIGTSNGLNVYDYKADSIIQVRTTTSPMKLLYNDITVLSGSNTATTWVGTYGNGVHYYDWKKKKFERLALEKAGDVSPLFVMSLFEDDNNRLWIGTRHDGLFCYDLTSRKLSYMELPENSMFIRTIFQDSFRRIWIGTSEIGRAHV